MLHQKNHHDYSIYDSAVSSRHLLGSAAAIGSTSQAITGVASTSLALAKHLLDSN